MEPEVTNAADPEQLELADEAIELTKRQKREDLTAVLSTPQGRRVLYELLEDCHMFETVFSSDALVMAFKAGEANVGQRLSARIEQTRPGALFGLMKQAAADRRAADAARRSRRKKRSEEAEP